MRKNNNLLVKNISIVGGFTLLLLCYGYFIFLINGNSVIYDEVRIIADFFTEYQNAASVTGKFRALFRRENETFPAFIRLLYLVSYWLVGNVRFDWLGYLANAIPVVFLISCFVKRKEFAVPTFGILLFSFIILNPYSDHIFLFTYASLFYFISILFPIGIVYTYIKGRNKLMICLLIILGLSSSTYFIIGLMLLFASLLQRRWRAAAFLFITILILKLIPIVLFDASDETDKLGVITKSFSYMPELFKLFFLTVGSWIQIFNIQVLNNFALLLGVVTFVVTCIIFVRNYIKTPKDERLQFYGILFIYCWLIFFSTTVFRWNFNFDYQYNAIFSPSKSFFVLIYLVLTVAFIFTFTSSAAVKKVLLLASTVFILSYFLNYYNGVNYWKTIYKSTVLAGVNYKSQHKSIDYRNLTFKDGYTGMVEKKLLIPAPTPFDNIDLEQKIADSSFVIDLQTGIDLFNEAKKNEVNMYDISIKPIVLYSYNFPFKGRLFNRMDGTYFYLRSEEDKLIIPARYVNNSPLNYLLRGQPYNTNWIIATIDNSFSLEVLKTTYDVYVLEVVGGQFAGMTNIKKQLIINDENEYSFIDSNS